MALFIWSPMAVLDPFGGALSKPAVDGAPPPSPRDRRRANAAGSPQGPTAVGELSDATPPWKSGTTGLAAHGAGPRKPANINLTLTL